MKHDKYKDISESIDLPNALNRRRALLMLGAVGTAGTLLQPVSARAAIKQRPRPASSLRVLVRRA